MKLEKDKALRMSKWTQVFKKNNSEYIALYHSLNMDIVFFEKKFIKLINALHLGTTVGYLYKIFRNFSVQIEEMIDELYRLEMIIPVQHNEMLLLEEKKKTHILSPGIETLYLIVTDNCNLRCSYCFINNNMPKNYHRDFMSFSIAKEALDMFFVNLAKNPPEYSSLTKTIFFYGGEPLLNFNLVKQSIEYIESVYENEIKTMGEKFRLSIVTNGTTINEEIAKFIGAHDNLDIAISVDGPKNIHDKKRRDTNNKGSFTKAIHGLKILQKVGNKKDISISSTVDEHNINDLPLLLKLHKKYNFASINLNPLVDTASNSISKKYMYEVSKKMIEYFMLAREVGVYEDRIMRKAKSFMNRRIHAYDCQALGAQLVCTPDGQLGICHEGIGTKQFFFDKVSKDFDFHNNSVIKEWKQRTPLNMPQCFACPAIGICGGGCAYGSWLRNGSIWSVDDRFCIHSLTTLKWLIWDLLTHL